jgi:hypothetical protein
MQHRAEPEAVELQVMEPQLVGNRTHAYECATGAGGPPTRAGLCPECARAWGHDHAPECVLRPVPRYADWLRELRASHPEDYWGKYVEYLT